MKLEKEGENFIVRVGIDEASTHDLKLSQALEDFYHGLNLNELKNKEMTLDLSLLTRVNSEVISNFVLLHNELAKNTTQLRILAKKKLKPPFDVVMLEKIISIEYLD